MNPFDRSPIGPRSVEEVTVSGVDFRWSEYMSYGFRAFGKDFGIYVAFTLVYIAISMFISAIPFVGSTIGLLVNPALIAGFIYYGRSQYLNDHRDFNTFFGGFRQPHWIALVLQNVVPTLIMVACTIPFFYEPIMQLLEDMEKLQTLPQEEVLEFVRGIWNNQLTIAAVLAASTYLIASTFLCLAPYFIVYRSQQFGEAIRSSFQVVKMRFFGFFALIITLWLVIVLGVMLCCVGLLAAFPIYHLALLAAFRDIMAEDQSATVD